MKCENCGAADAVVQYTQIQNNEMSTAHLCETCAAERGLEVAPPASNFPIAGLLAQIGAQSGIGDQLTADGACAFCGLSLDDFRETGRFGCPHCYETFEQGLRGLLRRIQGSHQHTGKVYLPPDPSVSDREARVEGLRRKLDRAVRSEDFERAAEIRDEIRSMGGG